jgi:hypothetical protein
VDIERLEHRIPGLAPDLRGRRGLLQPVAPLIDGCACAGRCLGMIDLDALAKCATAFHGFGRLTNLHQEG